ncbi:MAG: type I-C CRISPR-associated protein Cas8c/Csd1, partial [Oscillospiraceae bacterium]|nr:type I-C CRISPR-associated protein Cas8c/Csd1 [Oscillospiraceae bacterium]
DTLEGYAEAVNRATLGMESNLDGYNSKRVNYVCILGLKAPIPGKGNLAITYYQELPGNEYVERLAGWRQSCCWWRYNHKRKTVEIATPTSQDIAEAIMGADAVKIAQGKKKTGPKDTDPQETKLMRQLLSQLMSCIVDSQPLPLNLVQGAFHRACNPLSFTSGKDGNWSRYAWDQSVNATCAMISCFQKRGHTPNTEVFLPELQADSRNRDYLYGRLLAVADRMEEAVLDQSSRPTNAIRLTQRFAQRPFETWQMIHEKLLPVFQTAGEDVKRYQITLEEIESLFLEEDRLSQKPLRMEFLQGYSSQRQDWFKKRERDGDTPQKTETAILYKAPASRSRLYGCLLAIADIIEVKASDGERFGRTNAIQMMPMLAARPYDGWGQLHNKLLPYLEKLGDRAGYYQSLIGKTEAQFSQPDRESTLPLDSSYLNGYYEMLRTFYQKTQYLWQPQYWQEDTGDLRSLWYGRMLGASEWLERRMLLIRAGGTPEDAEQHAANALRYMAAFAQKPAATWAHLKDKLKPYLRYGAERTAASTLIEQLEAQLTQRGWDTNTPLNSSYLHGYYAERNKKGES